MRIKYKRYSKQSLYKDWKKLAFFMDEAYELMQQDKITAEDIKEYRKDMKRFKKELDNLEESTERYLQKWSE